MNTQWSDATNFHLRRSKPLPQAIADQLRRRIVSGNLPVGRRLPSLRKLAALYGVSLPTVYAAVQALAALGFVQISHGVGVYVSRPRSGAALLNHAFQNASTHELGLMRAAIDERMAEAAARTVERGPATAVPRRVRDLSFLAAERAARRSGYANEFLKADTAFHGAIAACVPGAEVAASAYEQIGRRLLPALLAVAERHAHDDALHSAHARLATAIMDGMPREAARIARAISQRELRALEGTLG